MLKKNVITVSLLILLALAAPLHSQVAITALPELIETPAAADVIPLVDVSVGTTKKVTYANLMGGNAASATTLAANPSDCGANVFAYQIDASGNLTCRAIVDADVPDTITLTNLTQITTRLYSDLQSIPSTFAPAAHVLNSATHTVSGLTAGQPLQALTGTTFGFAALAVGQVTQHVAAIDHDALLNFVAGEHVAHGGVIVTAGAGLGGGGDISTSFSLNTASQEAGFLADGGVTSLTCGAGTSGKMQTLDNGNIEYCDGAATPNLRVFDPTASGADDLGSGDPGANGVMVRTALNTTVARTITGTANEVEVTNGDGVAGNPVVGLPASITVNVTGALTGNADTATTATTANAGDSATAFFPSGTIELARLPSLYGIIDDENIPLTQRATLNFAGAGVTCADDTDQTTCTIAGGGSSINVEENNVEVISAANLTGIDFLGADFDVTDDLNEANVAISADIARDSEVTSAVNAAVSGTANFLAYFNGTNSVISSNIGAAANTLTLPVTTGLLAFGDGDTYIYENSDDSLRIRTFGVDRFFIVDTSVTSLTTGAFALRTPAGSAAAATYGFATDIDNGLYYIGANNWAATAGGTKIIDYQAAQVGFLTTTGLFSAAAPTTDAAGEAAFDNNAWAASRGAAQMFDGTANTYLVGTLASDVPTNGQVPTWKTGGIVEWETGSGGSDFLGDWSSPAALSLATGSVNLGTAGPKTLDVEGGVASTDDWTGATCAAGWAGPVRAFHDARSIVIISSSIPTPTGTDLTLDQDGDLALVICQTANTPEVILFFDESSQELYKPIDGGLSLTGTTTRPAGTVRIKISRHVDNADGLTDGEDGEIVYQKDTNTAYVCEPTVGLCDTAGEWIALSGGAETNSLEVITTGIQTTEILIGTAANTGVYAALSGDATMNNAGVVTVIDDLHAHTGTSISALDGADITTGSVAIAQGGTGQTTQTAAMDALSPTTTKGDLLVDNGTNVIRVPVGTNTQVLTADSAQASGVAWAAAGGTPFETLIAFDGPDSAVCDGGATYVTTSSVTIPSGTLAVGDGIKIFAIATNAGVDALTDVQVIFGDEAQGSLNLAASINWTSSWQCFFSAATTAQCALVYVSGASDIDASPRNVTVNNITSASNTIEYQEKDCATGGAHTVQKLYVTKLNF